MGWPRIVLLCETAAFADVPDGLHQMRVAIRRLRSVVAATRRMLPPEQYEWVTHTLKWMASVLGPARNWDVFSSSLLAPVRSVLPREQELDELCDVSEQERRSVHERASAAIRSPEYTAALLIAMVRLAQLEESTGLGTLGVADGADRHGGDDLDRAALQESK